MENKKTEYYYNVIVSGKGSFDFDTIKEAVKFIEKEAIKKSFFYLSFRKMGKTGVINFRIERKNPLNSEDKQ